MMPLAHRSRFGLIARPSTLTATPRLRFAVIAVSVLVALLFFAYAPLPHHVDNYRVATVNAVPYSTYYFSKQEWRPTKLKGVQSKYAYATFLGGNDYDRSGDDGYANWLVVCR